MRPYEFPDRVHLQLTYEFDLDLYRIDRDVYSILDWIGDIGGLNEGLFVILGIILSYFNYNTFEHFMIEHLFFKREQSAQHVGGKVFTQLQDKKTRICRQKMIQCCPASCKRRFLCFKVCNLSKEERLFARARQSFEKEINIVLFLKKIRRLETFQRELTQQLDLDTSKVMKSELVTIDDSSNDDYIDDGSLGDKRNDPNEKKIATRQIVEALNNQDSTMIDNTL